MSAAAAAGSKRKAETPLAAPRDATEVYQPATWKELQDMRYLFNEYKISMRNEPGGRSVSTSFSNGQPEHAMALWEMLNGRVPRDRSVITIGLVPAMSRPKTARDRDLALRIILVMLRGCDVDQRDMLLVNGMSLASTAGDTITIADAERWHRLYPVLYFDGDASMFDLSAMIWASHIADRDEYPLEMSHYRRFPQEVLASFLVARLEEELAAGYVSSEAAATVFVHLAMRSGLSYEIEQRKAFVARRLALQVPLTHICDMVDGGFLCELRRRFAQNGTSIGGAVPFVYRTTCSVLVHSTHFEVVIARLARERRHALGVLFRAHRYFSTVRDLDLLTLSYLGGVTQRIEPFAAVTVAGWPCDAGTLSPVPVPAPAVPEEKWLDEEPLMWASLFLSQYTADLLERLFNPLLSTEGLLALRVETGKIRSAVIETAMSEVRRLL